MGPATGIILREELTGNLKNIIVSEIQALADSATGEDFWINGAPFIYSFGGEYEGEQKVYDAIKQKIGWAPKDQLVFAAMCNQPEDYMHLGDLCVKFSSLLNGFVELGLPLSDYTNDEKLLNHAEHIQYNGASLLGPKLMKMWRNHKDFWMVK